MATIYSLNGQIITEGLPSSIASDEAFKTAQRITKETQKSVIVEDVAARQLYRVSVAGRAWAPPTDWIPVWEES